MVKTWLITGGNGFIGTNLREAIKKEMPDDRVVVVDVKKYNRQFRDNSKMANVNVANFRAMDKVFMKYKPDYVVHLAAETGARDSVNHPKKSLEKNIMGTLNCLELAGKWNKDCHVVVASSCGVVGEQFHKMDEDSRCDPINPYGTSKLCAEKIARCYMRLGLGVCNLRFSNVYGPWSEHKESVVTKFIKASLNDECLMINGSGDQTRNFIYVKDAVESILLCMKKKAVGTYCIASHFSMSINDLVSVICENGGGDAEIDFVGECAQGDIAEIDLDNSKARRELMFQCKYSISDGIADTIQWFEELKLEPLLKKT